MNKDDEILEYLKRIEDKLDELIELLTESSPGLEDEVEESYFCPRCGKALKEGTFTHLCEV